ncbi:hypothetical protein SteCoe_38668 [Stentor coeruleus]|uniref:MORN repeat protein n=1 Tax=Stentor coeruleus TaxID=5963 RepID=A0A1R2AL69_9CILI|nr:hypothetical protein SteCoe_38668 [Stentor coeruleus]
MGCAMAKPENSISIVRLGFNRYRVEYIDGSTYTGQYKKSLRSGIGEFITKEGETYDGKWENDQKSGKGCYKYNNGDIYFGEWSGDNINGKGRFKSESLGEFYDGDWIAGKKDGFGKANFKNEMIYEGYWITNEMDGKGKMTWPQGHVYEGQFKKNFLSGKGRFTMKSGKVYRAPEKIEPIWNFGRILLENNLKIPNEISEIRCLCITIDWNIYEGLIKFKDEQAYGIFLDSNTRNCDILESLTGEGTLTFIDGSFTMGSWKKYFMYYGYGISCIKKKEIYKGTLKDNIKTGYGVCRYSNRTYKGYWKDNVKAGIGKLISDHYKGYFTEIFTGKWSNDIRESGKLVAEYRYSITGYFDNAIEKEKEKSKGLFDSKRDYYEGMLTGEYKEGKGIMHYQDGSTYKGDWKDNKRHGKGIYTSNNGSYFIGKWECDKKIFGVTSVDPDTLYYYSNDEISSEYQPPGIEEYTGGYENGIRYGKGTCKYANGDVYKGNWENGKKHGEGKFEWPNKQSYKGNWEWDEIEGEGTLKMPDGSKYTGSFCKGIYHGKGELQMADGTIINSTWANGKSEGFATIQYSNGNYYEGPTKNLLKEGKGTLIYPGGKTYIGYFENDLCHGKGKEIYENDENFKGTWLNGKKHGFGVYQDEFYNKFEGEWNMDQKQGKFIITFRTGEIFTVTFSHNEPEGEGVLDFSNCKESLGAEIDYQKILINDEGAKNVTWKSPEIIEILKKTRKIKRGKYLYYSNPDTYHMLKKCFLTTDVRF